VIGGERIDAATALAWGLVDRVVEPDELVAESLSLATRIAAFPPLAVSMAKQLIDQGVNASLRDGLTNELIAQVALFASADYAEARAARREGRAPEYRGH
jgi:enoyl-CoA hydratase